MAEKDENSNEFSSFLIKHSDLDNLEVLVPDMNGILRGKRIDVAEAKTLYTKGINLPAGTHLLDSGGDVIDGLILGTDDGDPDMIATPVEHSLTMVPWLENPTAQTIITLSDQENVPYAFESRNIAKKALSIINDQGVFPVVAVELEFYLIHDPDALSVSPRHGPVPGTRLHQEGPQVYSLEDLRELDPFFNQLKKNCELQSIPAGTAISEFSAGQFEVNLHHVDDPVLACDQALLLRRVVRETAKSFGLGATFMAKPFMESAGSGMHIHISLKDQEGENLFKFDKGDQTGFNKALQYAVGGLVQTMSEGVAIFCPNANSYRRFQPGFFAPITPNWGPNHRNVSIRIPLSDENNVRIEHRAAGADANPYLVLAAVLGGISDGLKNNTKPPQMIAQGEIIDPEITLPVRWETALSVFEKAKILPNYLGAEYSKVFLHSRRCECDRFHSQIGNKDFEWYLRSI